MKITTFSAATSSDLAEQLAAVEADFATVHVNCTCDAFTLPAIGALHGATSCLGAMTTAGIHDGAIAFVIEDPDGCYGTAMAAYGDDPVAAAHQAIETALARAGRVGETPDLVWIAATPGVEEAVLAGLQEVVSSDVPIIGGSAADNSVEGNWFVFDNEGSNQAGLVVSVLFPSTAISFAYQNGYSPKTNSGVVTKATERTLHEIDGRPAMEVYSEWTGGDVRLSDGASEAEAILSASTLWPLGREVSDVGGVPFYLLAHPAMAHPNGDIDLFATVAEGERLTAMNGTADSLIDRAGRVAGLARKLGPGSSGGEIAGALMIYCGGCMLSVRDELSRVVSGVNDALDSAPFLGAFTFGEQGSLLGAGNAHGNLMISCIVFEAD